LTSPQVDQSATWLTAIWFVGELSGYPIRLYHAFNGEYNSVRNLSVYNTNRAQSTHTTQYNTISRDTWPGIEVCIPKRMRGHHFDNSAMINKLHF